MSGYLNNSFRFKYLTSEQLTLGALSDGREAIPPMHTQADGFSGENVL